MRRSNKLGADSPLAAGLLLLALLLVPPTAAGWADLALTPPGEPELLPRDAYRPISWTQQQVESMRRRALLQQLAGGGGGGAAVPQLPVCELQLSYRVVDLTAANFSSVATITNNRELDLLHWQVVWRFADFRHVVLSRADGAIQLSPGSPSGAPVRLVDTFQNDGIPGGGRRGLWGAGAASGRAGG